MDIDSYPIVLISQCAAILLTKEIYTCYLRSCSGKLATATGHAMQIFSDLHYSNLYKCIVFYLFKYNFFSIAWPVAMKKTHFQFKKNCNVKSILTENQVISQNIKRPNMGSQMSEMWTWKWITNLVPQGLPARFSMAAILEVDELLVIDFIEKIKNVSSPSFRICKNLLKMLNPKIVYKPLHFLEIGQNTVTHISNFRPIWMNICSN